MDEFNNDKNPFDEQPSGGQDVNPYAQHDNQQQDFNPYAQQGGNPYNQQSQQNVNPYNQPAPNPYNQQQNANPYQQNPYYQQNQQNFNPYAQQGMQPLYQQTSTGMATASLVLGIISIVMGIPMMALPFLFLVPVIGLILGIVFKTKRLPVGKGLSTAGIITSSIGIVLPIVAVVGFSVWLVANGPEFMAYLKENYPTYYDLFYSEFYDTFPEWFESVLYFIFK